MYVCIIYTHVHTYACMYVYTHPQTGVSVAPCYVSDANVLRLALEARPSRQPRPP